MVDLVRELEGGGEVERLAAMNVAERLGYLSPRLEELTKAPPAEGRHGPPRHRQPSIARAIEGCSACIFQPVAQGPIKALVPQDLGLLGSRDPRYGGRIDPRAVCATGCFMHPGHARNYPAAHSPSWSIRPSKR